MIKPHGIMVFHRTRRAKQQHRNGWWRGAPKESIVPKGGPSCLTLMGCGSKILAEIGMVSGTVRESVRFGWVVGRDMILPRCELTFFISLNALTPGRRLQCSVPWEELWGVCVKRHPVVSQKRPTAAEAWRFTETARPSTSSHSSPPPPRPYSLPCDCAKHGAERRCPPELVARWQGETRLIKARQAKSRLQFFFQPPEESAFY